MFRARPGTLIVPKKSNSTVIAARFHQALLYKIFSKIICRASTVRVDIELGTNVKLIKYANQVKYIICTYLLDCRSISATVSDSSDNHSSKQNRAAIFVTLEHDLAGYISPLSR